MPHKTIAIASDHAGFELKGKIIAELEGLGYKVRNFGTNSADPVDYPDYAKKVAEYISEGQAAFGVLICGSGIGMSIAANRYPLVRAALARDIEDAVLSRQHNNANILVFGARQTDETLAIDILKVFLTTPFMEGRHRIRVAKLSELPAKSSSENTSKQKGKKK